MHHTKFVRAKTGITFLIAVFLLAEPASSQEIIIGDLYQFSSPPPPPSM